MSYDVKCEELAKEFLSEGSCTKEELESLAQAIQDAIEDWVIGKGKSS